MGRKPLKNTMQLALVYDLPTSRDRGRGLVASGTKRLEESHAPREKQVDVNAGPPVKHESVAVLLQCLLKAIQPIRGKPGKRARLSYAA